MLREFIENGVASIVQMEANKVLNPIEISLLGRNEIAREGLRRILACEDFSIKNSAACPAAINIPHEEDHTLGEHIIVVDNGADHEGIDNCRTLATMYPDARLVLLSDNFEFDDVAAAFRLGVDGYIIKEISCEPLVESLKLVALGEKVLPSQLARNLGSYQSIALSEDWKSCTQSAGLSDREVEILACLMSGMANKVISRQLNICEATVKVHVKAILRKLRVSNRTQAAIWAVKHGLEKRLDANIDASFEEDDEAEVAGRATTEAILGYAA